MNRNISCSLELTLFSSIQIKKNITLNKKDSKFDKEAFIFFLLANF